MSLACLPLPVCVQLGVGLGSEGRHMVETCALCPRVECPAFSSGLCNGLGLQGCIVRKQHCMSLWSPGKTWSKISSIAEVPLLLDLCNRCLSVVPGEVRVRSYNFCWSVARHKLLILTEQSPPVQQTGRVPVDQTLWRIFWFLLCLWAKDHCRWEEMSCTNAGFRFAFSYVLSLHTDFGRS